MDPIVKEEILELEEGELVERDLDWDVTLPSGDPASWEKTKVSNLGIEDRSQLKRPKIEDVVLPLGFPLPPTIPLKKRKIDGYPRVAPASGLLVPLPRKKLPPPPVPVPAPVQRCKQFWKAGDYEGFPASQLASASEDMDHLRVHPKFLHSNATSHKWVLGALAELLDNSVDEVCHGATYVKVDMLENKKDGTKILIVQDDGGGMDPEKMRQCMSLGYSVKGKTANTIGQYGNGFKTSTMRLGADVIVFSRCAGKDGSRPTQSIGMLSYTFLTKTRKEDIVVPMIDYEKERVGWSKMTRSSPVVWTKNMETIVHWSPYFGEADLLQQFSSMTDHGTRIVIYNLWEDDQGDLELDFDADNHDIQVRGVNQDEKKIKMAQQFPNSRHFLTYQHSLRSYASILYLRLPHCFRIVLRGIEVEHHNVVNDMMFTQDMTYKPKLNAIGAPKNQDMVAVVSIGFVKDAKHHVDVQGFNVYHKNRLIKPFWRIWNAAGSNGRGVIGVLEANFVEPAHDKQGFELTTVLSRLESKLLQMQKTYWKENCNKIGYVTSFGVKEGSHQASPRPSSQHPRNDPSSSRMSAGANKSERNIAHQSSDNTSLRLNHKMGGTDSTVRLATSRDVTSANGHARDLVTKGAENFEKDLNSQESRLRGSSYAANNHCGPENVLIPASRPLNVSGSSKASLVQTFSQKDNGSVGSSAPTGGSGIDHAATGSQLKVTGAICNGSQPKIENNSIHKKFTYKVLIDRIKKTEDLRKSTLCKLQDEKDRNQELTERVQNETDRNEALTERVQYEVDRNEELTKRVQYEKDRNEVLTERVQNETDRNEALTERVQYEVDRNEELTKRVQYEMDRNEELTQRVKGYDVEQVALIEFFMVETSRRDKLEENLRQELMELREKLSSDGKQD